LITVNYPLIIIVRAAVMTAALSIKHRPKLKHKPVQHLEYVIPYEYDENTSLKHIRFGDYTN